MSIKVGDKKVLKLRPEVTDIDPALLQFDNMMVQVERLVEERSTGDLYNVILLSDGGSFRAFSDELFEPDQTTQGG